MAEFELTEEHILLASKMRVRWQNCEYGAPEIDPKRPYGNSDVENDICEILGKQMVEVDYEEKYSTEDLQYAKKIHNEMEIALQIILENKTFKPGLY